MKIEAKWQNGMHFRSNSETQHSVDYDSGPKDSVTSGPTPMEVVLQAAAACSGMDVISILEKKRIKPEIFEIVVSGERAESHPKVFTEVDLQYRFKGEGLTETNIKQAVKLSIDKYCSVLEMLRSTAKINWNIEIIK